MLPRLAPDLGAAWANRAQCWLKMGDPAKALADAEKCTEVEPANLGRPLEILCYRFFSPWWGYVDNT